MCVWVVWCLQRVYTGVAYVSIHVSEGVVHMNGTQPGSCLLFGGSKVTFESHFHILWNPVVAPHVHGWSSRILSFYCPVCSEHALHHFLHLLMLGLLLDMLFVIFPDNSFSQLSLSSWFRIQSGLSCPSSEQDQMSPVT